jgi:hypothetical protein
LAWTGRSHDILFLNTSASPRYGLRFVAPSRHGWRHFASATWRLSTSPIFCATVPEVLFGRVAAVVLPRSFFPLGPLDYALVASMVAPRPFCDSAGQESRNLWRRAKKQCVCVCVCGRNGAHGQGCLHHHHTHPLSEQPRYITLLRVKSFVPPGAVAIGGRSYTTSGLAQPLLGRNLLLKSLSSSTSSCVLSVLSHILDLGFFYLVVVLPAGGQREHKGFLFPHVLIKITRECKTVFYLLLNLNLCVVFLCYTR